MSEDSLRSGTCLRALRGRQPAVRARTLALTTATVAVLSLVAGGSARSAPAAIPAGMLTLYREAALDCPGLPWQVLAAVGKIESDHGRNAHTSSAGAVGPMQFMPATWRIYGRDANTDGVLDPRDPVDAAHGTAAMLCAMGGGDPGRLATAVARYNPGAPWYSGAVMAEAARYGLGSGRIRLAALEPAGSLAGGHVLLSRAAADDVDAGLVDPALVRLLEKIGQRHVIEVSVFRTGHSRYVEGTKRISLHMQGRAADVSGVDGQPVSVSNAGARDVVGWLAGLEAPVRPVEVGSPFTDVTGAGIFSDGSHRDHIHIGMAEPGAATIPVSTGRGVAAPQVTRPGDPGTCTPGSCPSESDGGQAPVASFTCLGSACSGVFAGKAASWSCSASACYGSFAGRQSSWACGPAGCSGTLGEGAAWWSCQPGGCSGLFGPTPRSWTCSDAGCAGSMPFELAALQSRSRDGGWPGLTG
ncbi:MAG TPA: transglycosylase SLT domain-containing protein [Actinomycetota bacterium]